MGKVVGNVLDVFTGADQTRKAAEQAAAAQREAALKGGIASAFRPVGITTRFGTSDFTVETDPATGLPRVTQAGYTVSPELQAIQNQLMGLTGGAMTTAQQAQAAAAPLGAGAQGLFNLGQQYLGESPEAIRQRYIQQQQALLEPARQQEEQRLGASVFGRGRAGLNVAGQGQPELYALAQARREQDLALAAQAEQAAQQQLGFGANLYGTGASMLGQQYAIPTQALGPLQSYLGTAQTIEELGQQPFQLGMQVGGQVAQGGQAGGQLLSSGLTQAANTQFQGVQSANAMNTQFLSGLIQGGMKAAFPGQKAQTTTT